MVLAIVMVPAEVVLVAAERYSSSHVYRRSTRRRPGRSWPLYPVPVWGSSAEPEAASSVHGRRFLFAMAVCIAAGAVVAIYA